MENLDRLCAEYGFKFVGEMIGAEGKLDAKKAESLITKALGVLQEQGLYAFLLFCQSRGSAEEKGSQKLIGLTEELLKDKLQLVNGPNLLEEIRKDKGLLTKLDDLMLAIQVLEKSLIYARYNAKAFSNSAEQTQSNEGAEK